MTQKASSETQSLADNDIGAALAEIAAEAARLILPLWRTGLEVIEKSDKSPVTEADRRDRPVPWWHAELPA